MTHPARRPNFLCVAALSTLACTSHAWVASTGPVTYHVSDSGPLSMYPNSIGRCNTQPSFDRHDFLNRRERRGYSSTRLLASGKGNGIVSRLGRIVRRILPTRIFGTQEEKAQLAQRREVQGQLNQALKEAPFAVRALGRLVAPLISGVASQLAESVAAQQRTIQEVLDDARRYLINDPSAIQLLGEPIALGAPISQSSASSSINGKSQTRIDLILPVKGSRGSGTLRLVATQDGISQMLLDAGGQSINVSMQSPSISGSRSSSKFSSSSKTNGDDNIIEAEIIDKKTK